MTDPLNLRQRLKRPTVRPARARRINVRLTDDEHARLSKMASGSKLLLSEWMRETLLHKVCATEEAASPVSNTERAIFTELVLLRSLIEAILPSIAIGQKLTLDVLRKTADEVRAGKHEYAREVMGQYLYPLGEKL